jgi:dTDP-4-dehydrorhamnose reductase
MRIIVTGAGGMLGRALGRVMDVRGVDYRPHFHPGLDITDRSSVDAAFRAERPDWAVHAAAFTQVDNCEGDPGYAFSVNAQGTRNVAEAASAVGTRILYISTDYVFDGQKGVPYKEGDQPAPINVYGESKLAGEKAVREKMPESNWVIVRTAWLYGDGGNNFVDQIVRRAEEGQALAVVDDQVGSPTWTMVLARAIKAIVDTELAGMYHVVCSGVASWFELAEEILRLMGAKVPLEPISTEALERLAKRPLSSALDASKFKRDTGLSLETWQEALAAYLKERRLVAGF